MSNYSIELLTSLNELGLIITNVRSLANMDASRDSEETKKERNKAKQPVKKQQVTGAHSQQQNKGSNRGQRQVKDERENTRPTTSSHELAKASYGGTSFFGLRRRSTGNKSSMILSGQKRNKKSFSQPQDRPTHPSTSVTHTEVVEELDDDDDLETFDIDCSPYNNDQGWNEDESEREQRDGGRSRGGFGSFQSGRSRRTVSPYPYRLKLKKQNKKEWAVDESYDPWDEGSFFDDGPRASSGFVEENPPFRWHAEDSMEDRLGDLNLQDRYTAIDHGDHDNHLKPCLKKKAHYDDQRLAMMNVSWNDENNEFDVAAEDDNEDNGSYKMEANDQSCTVEERQQDMPDFSLQKQAETDPSQELMELRLTKIPANSTDEAASLEASTKPVDTGTGDIRSPPISDDAVCRGDIDAIQYSETNGKTCCDFSKCRSSNDKDQTTHPQSLLEEWTDDAISQLTDDEKYRLMKEQEHLEIARYDDPHLCRADRIKLLWEDCARKERLLHKLRPSSSKSLGSKGSAPTTNVNRYNHYTY